MKLACWMNPAFGLILLASLACATETQTAATPSSTEQDLDAILGRIHQAAQASNDDLARLRIDKWRMQRDQKPEMQKIATSVQRNATYAVPDLIQDVRSGHGSVSSTFRLYHNLNVLYEYLNVLAQAASTAGQPEEYTPLAQDTAALDGARQELSAYIEQAASGLEAKAARPATPAQAANTKPKRIVIDDIPARRITSKKRRTSAPAPQPAATPN